MTISFRYAHLADLHLGSWRDQKMRDLSTQAFLQAMDTCIRLPVDFILFAGDIFNTSLPAVDILKIVTKKLKELQEKDIPLYVIAGSHDFSPSGKTMIDVLEHAGLLRNVCKGTANPQTNKLLLQFTIDKKTGAKITGVLGKKGQLDTHYYEDLAREPLELEQGYKIFMFHTTISELKPKHLEQIESQPASFLPKGFQYYAGGHIHHRTELLLPEYGALTYPGALFPNNFAEIEKYGHGGFYLVTVSDLHQSLEWIPVQVAKHQKLLLDCTGKSPEVITFEILHAFNKQNLQETIITLRLAGTLAGGSASHVNWKEIFDMLSQQGAVVVMKNTAELHAETFEELHLAEAAPEVIEERLLHEHLQQSTIFGKEEEFRMAKDLLVALHLNKKEGETVTDFQRRVCAEAERVSRVVK